MNSIDKINVNIMNLVRKYLKNCKIKTIIIEYGRKCHTIYYK